MRQGLLGCTRVLIHKKSRGDAGGCPTPARTVTFALHELFPWGAQQARPWGNAWTHTLIRHTGPPPTLASTMRPASWLRWSDVRHRGLAMGRSQPETVCALQPAALRPSPVPSSTLLARLAPLTPVPGRPRPRGPSRPRCDCAVAGLGGRVRGAAGGPLLGDRLAGRSVAGPRRAGRARLGQ